MQGNQNMGSPDSYITDSYLQIKKDITQLIDDELERMLNTPSMEHIFIKKH
jgi:hypothetical protein